MSRMSFQKKSDMTWGWDAETINSMDFQEERGDSHMSVSLNGGTPKTPQNDHF